MRHSLPTRPQAARLCPGHRDRRTRRCGGPGHDPNAPCAFRGDAPCGRWRLHGRQPRLFGHRIGYGAGLARAGRLPCVHRCAAHPPPGFSVQSAASGLESRLWRSFRAMRRRRGGHANRPADHPRRRQLRAGWPPRDLTGRPRSKRKGQCSERPLRQGLAHAPIPLIGPQPARSTKARAPSRRSGALWGQDRARAMASAHNKNKTEE